MSLCPTPHIAFGGENCRVTPGDVTDDVGLDVRESWRPVLMVEKNDSAYRLAEDDLVPLSISIMAKALLLNGLIKS